MTDINKDIQKETKYFSIKQLLKEEIEYAKDHPFNTIKTYVLNCILYLILILLIMFLLTRAYECEYQGITYKPEGFSQMILSKQTNAFETNLITPSTPIEKPICTFSHKNLLQKQGYIKQEEIK